MVLGLLIFLTVGSFVSGISIHDPDSFYDSYNIAVARRKPMRMKNPTSNDDIGSGKPDDDRGTASPMIAHPAAR